MTRGERTTIEGETFQPAPLLMKEGPPFLPANQIEASLNRTFGRLADERYLRDLPREDFATRAADLLGAINTAHVFRRFWQVNPGQAEFAQWLSDFQTATSKACCQV